MFYFGQIYMITDNFCERKNGDLALKMKIPTLLWHIKSSVVKSDGYFKAIQLRSNLLPGKNIDLRDLA